MSELNQRPTSIASTVALFAVLGGVLSTVIDPIPGTVVGTLGIVLFSAGLARGSRRILDLGAFVCVVGVGLSAVAAPPAWPLVGTISLVVAWDLGGAGIRLGRQLGRDADTIRLELWYVLSSVTVGLTTGGLAYGIYVVSARGLTLDALVVILLAGIAATLALGTRLGWNENVVGR